MLIVINRKRITMMLLILCHLMDVMRIKLASDTEDISKDFKFFRAEHSVKHLPPMGALGVTVIRTNNDKNKLATD